MPLNSFKVKLKVLLAQSCLTLVTPWTIASDHGTLQARILEWVAIPFSRGMFPQIVTLKPNTFVGKKGRQSYT